MLLPALLLCCALLLTACGGKGGASTSSEKQETAEAEKETEAGEEETEDAQKDISAMPKAVITVKNYGPITVALDAVAASAYVEKFHESTKDGFHAEECLHLLIFH